MTSAPPQKLGVRLGTNEDRSELYILHGDTREKLLTLIADEDTRVLSVTVADHALVDVANIALALAVVTTPQAGAPAGIVRNWRIDVLADGSKEFVVWYSGREVRLPVAATPGPQTPVKPVPETYGQDLMLYVMAVGIKTGGHTLLSGPTGTAKTMTWLWLAQTLNYNLVAMPMSGSTEAAHLIGEYMPSQTASGTLGVDWTDGPVVAAVRLSQTHPTILLLDEFNRIRNIAEVARIYPLLDNQRSIELVEKRNGKGTERIDAGELYIGGTMNPADDDSADYSGVIELDPALMSRWHNLPDIGYPPQDIEVRALMSRVKTLKSSDANKMVGAARRIRDAVEVRYPISFRELSAWGTMMEYLDYEKAAEVTVVRKATAEARPSVRNLLRLQGS